MSNPYPPLTTEEVLAATGGVLVGGEGGRTFRGVSIDSRTIVPGNLFVALKGERFDGHDFAAAAARGGAAGLVVDRDIQGVPSGTTVILVRDTVRALGDLARYWRGRFAVPVLAVTGSAGKTTTKEMAAAVLGLDRSVLKTEGNLNNLIGLPLTLLGLAGHHEAAVLELGTNTPGEIARLTQIAAPTAAVITNIGPAHLEGFGSLEGVRREKTDLFLTMPPGGDVAVNNDDPLLRDYASARHRRRVTFGLSPGSLVTARNIAPSPGGGLSFELIVGGEGGPMTLPVAGRHNLSNALAAAAAAWILGAAPVRIREGLAAFRPVKGRMEIVKLANGSYLVDDSYNANPLSVAEALGAVRELKGTGRALVVLGDMLELGAGAADWHRKIGALLAETGTDEVFLKGDFAPETAAGAREGGMAAARIHEFSDPEEAAGLILSVAAPGDWILVKGSRRMKMDAVAALIAARAGRGEERA